MASDRDKVRLLIGDTDTNKPLLFDDEIDSILDSRSFRPSTGGTIHNIPAAAADAAGAIAAKFSRDFNFAEDGQNFQVAQRAAAYRLLESDLRMRQGGISVPTTLAGTATV